MNCIQSFVDMDNIEYLLFINDKYQWCVGLYDLDVETNNTIGIFICQDEAQARKKFDTYTKELP